MIRATAITLTATCVLAQGALADVFTSKNRAAMFNSQTRLLDNRAAQQYKNSVRLQPPQVVTPSKVPGPRWEGNNQSPPWQGNYRGAFLKMAREAARRHNIPEDLFLRLVQQESNWNPTARSHAGAIGLAQLMPGTARYLKVDPHDPYQNLDGGARYLKEQFRTFGSWRLALAAYNAGPGAVKRHGGIPPFRETQDYVRIILGS